MFAEGFWWSMHIIPWGSSSIPGKRWRLIVSFVHLFGWRLCWCWGSNLNIHHVTNRLYWIINHYSLLIIKNNGRARRDCGGFWRAYFLVSGVFWDFQEPSCSAALLSRQKNACTMVCTIGTSMYTTGLTRNVACVCKNPDSHWLISFKQANCFIKRC